MQKIAIIIPCYNEEKRIRKDLVTQLLDNSSADVYLCNDGSKDNTLAVLNNIADYDKSKCFVIHNERNAGKANTIYKAANVLLNKEAYTHIGYFDADFSTPVAEVIRLLEIQAGNPDAFIIGSRVLLLNTKIERKRHRHIIGRIIVTLVNLKLKLGVYDTQCGAKIFPVSMAKVGFATPFETSWLFDIELFIRLKHNNMLGLGREIPLTSWKDIDGSKLTWKTGFKIIKELITIYSK
jgi:glycosyltransferase involved in cell wall biosynthesis